MVQRQFPRPAEVLDLMRFKKPEFNAKQRRLKAALTIDDLRDIAKRRTPTAAFDYTDGAADAELSLARARQAFEDVEFHPSILRDVSTVDTTDDDLRRTVGPAVRHRADRIHPAHADRGRDRRGVRRRRRGHPVHPLDARHHVDRGCQGGEPATGATGSSCTSCATARSPTTSSSAPRRPASTRCIFTVDTPVAGARLRDKRNGFSIPPQLTLGTILDALPRPWWWWDFLTTPKLEFASLSSTGGTVGELLDAAMDPTISFDDLDVIRDMWPGKLVIKGVQNVEDAKRLTDLGVDGILLSNHGGRQLDRAPVPFHLLPEVVREVGKDAEVTSTPAS